MGALSAKAVTTPVVAPVAMIYDPDKKVSVVVYDMERFAQDCVNVFSELSGCEKKNVGAAPTPFIDESKDPLPVIEEPPSSAKAQTAPKGAHTNGGSIPKGVAPGQLSHSATKCLMKILYIARFARQDLLRAVGVLTTKITCWDEIFDRKLLRIIKYMNGSLEWRQVGFIGDKLQYLELCFSLTPILPETGPT